MLPPVADEEWEVDLPAPEVALEADVPSCELSDEEVEGTQFSYSTRAPTDFVVSGPIGDVPGPGRRFPSVEKAERWARERYGKRFKGRIPEATQYGGNRFAFLVSAPKEADALNRG